MTASLDSRCHTCFARLSSGAGCSDPACIADAEHRTANDLPVGTELNHQFTIGRVLGRGGFGITYLAWDERLARLTAVKECFPVDLVRRSRDGITVTPISDQAKRQFATGLHLFKREAQVLARFQTEPGIVSVLSVFEANSTAYMAMEFLSGRTLKAYLESDDDGRIDFGEAVQLLRPVMHALSVVHAEQWLHRDVSPDNIFVTDLGDIRVLDFGAARYTIGEQTRSLPIIAKAGFTPFEQHSAKGNQGPWTDVYALAATFYRAITGVIPPGALDRVEADELVPPSELGIDIPPRAETALLNALAVRPAKRTQSVSDLQHELEDAWTQLQQERAALRQRQSQRSTRPLPHSPHPTVPQTSDGSAALRPVADVSPEPKREQLQAPADRTVPAGLNAPRALTAFSVCAGLLLVGWMSRTVIVPSSSEPGFVMVDAMPWAAIKRIVNESGETQSIPAPNGTPILISLPPGKYTITLQGPEGGAQSREVVAEVRPGVRTELPVERFAEITAEEYLK
jgi:serine/threonine protein kinase